jgi:hypothetical protein
MRRRCHGFWCRDLGADSRLPVGSAWIAWCGSLCPTTLDLLGLGFGLGLGCYRGEDCERATRGDAELRTSSRRRVTFSSRASCHAVLACVSRNRRRRVSL